MNTKKTDSATSCIVWIVLLFVFVTLPSLACALGFYFVYKLP